MEPPPAQSSITDFYGPVSAAENARQNTANFRKKRREKRTRCRMQEREAAAATTAATAAMHQDDLTYGYVTQNVNGFGANSARRRDWWQHFRTSDDHGKQDIVLLQETHVEPAEVPAVESEHSLQWGYRPGSKRLSFWAPSKNKKGGVAILVNPYGAFAKMTPYEQDKWSPHFMAVTGELDGTAVVVVNIYAPHQRADRERFFRGLMQISFPDGAKVFAGGDFNCTLDKVTDRTYQTAAALHGSPALGDLLANWAMLDPVALQRPATWTATALLQHHQATHTYHYTVPETGAASARLDKWYVTASALEWVAHNEVVTPGVPTDHQGVKLHLSSPLDPIRIRKPATVFPVPVYAAKEVDFQIRDMLHGFLTRLDAETRTPAEWAAEWDVLKVELVKMTLRLKKERRKAARNSIRQKLKRLVKQLQRVHEEARGMTLTVEGLTDLMAGLSLVDIPGPTREARLRRAISACKGRKASLRQQQTFDAASHWTGKSTKAMFRRISNKFRDNTIRRLDAVPGSPARGSHDNPDIFADAWTPVLQQPATQADRITEVVGWMGDPAVPSTGQLAMTADFSEAEVRAAIRACKCGKATGPDHLGNDWYRHYEDELVPLLTRLLDMWYKAGVFPASFLDADIFCLKKGGDQRNALNYRPLALLNTDYKVLTRILATRMRATLMERIHPNQNGFVPGRTIHETLHLFEAAQQMILADPAQQDAMVMLLDFKKAYDSLDRQFMLQVLRQHGYPEQFVQAIGALHDGTQASFLANGGKSRNIKITSGIRQGCPLAPMLFILALEPLYRRIDMEPGLTGVVMQSAAGALELRVAGYADDTALYLQSSQNIAKCTEITTEFGEASGLRLNVAKTMVIPLGNLPAGAELASRVSLQEHGTTGRYLGLQVGSPPAPERSWAVAEKQLQTRLHLASVKTTTVDQRSMIAAAIIIPKLTYIAQHAWPSTATIARLDRKVRHYVWHATFATEVGGARAWLNADLAAMGRTQGGMAIPQLRTELLAMAAVAVRRWACNGTEAQHIVGDVLFAGKAAASARAVTITPNYVPPSQAVSRCLGSMWATGRRVLTMAGGLQLHEQRADMIRAMWHLAVSFDGLVVTTEGAGYRVDGSQMLKSVHRLMTATLGSTDGVQCLEWLKAAVIGELFLYQEDGSFAPTPVRLRGRSCSHDCVADVMEWKLMAKGVLLVQTVTRPARRPAKRITGAPGLKAFITALVINFPLLLTRQYRAAEVRMVALPDDHPLTADVCGRRLRLVAGPAHTILATKVTSQQDLHTRIAVAARPEVRVRYVHPHPQITRMVCLWAAPRRRPASRRLLKGHIAHASRRQGIRQGDKRAAAWAANSAAATAGLNKLEWKRIRRILGLGPWGEQVLYRIKARAFSMYDMRNGRHGCPHAGCAHEVDVDLHHVFWTCPAAQRLRAVFTHKWMMLGVKARDLEAACFGLELPELPQAFWEAAAEGKEGFVGDATLLDEMVTALAEGCWRLGAALYFQAVWRWRVQHFDETNNVSARLHATALANRLRQGYYTMHNYSKDLRPEATLEMAASVVTNCLDAKWQGAQQEVAAADCSYLLFFDGGSRGNPGPGGAGAVIVRLGRLEGQFQVVWAGSMSYAAPATTNNLAENMGLLAGIRACGEHGFTPVHVVGDSMMIISQHRTRRPPHATHLKPLYWKCRRGLASVTVLTWSHHLRGFNKMADSLANLAMDARQSKQALIGADEQLAPRWGNLLQLAEGDVGHWALTHGAEAT